MRREALVTQASDMHYLEDYRLYKIYVYKNTPQEYVCFTTPEAAEAINLYLKQYNVDKSGYFKHINVTAMSNTLNEICDKAGIKKLDVNRNEIPAVHGFRKFCITKMAQADRDENGKIVKETRVNTEIAKLLTGHSMGVRGEYVEYDDDDLLQEYLKAVDRLTIHNENRLKSELDYLKGEKDKKLKALELQVKDQLRERQLVEKDIRIFREELQQLKWIIERHQEARIELEMKDADPERRKSLEEMLKESKQGKIFA